MSGWFHQDFDLVGESVRDVVREFRKVTALHELAELKADVAGFLARNENDLDEAFIQEFHPDVIPAVMSGSTRAFLEAVSAELAR